eukprot:6203928-Pleurochrysis_carterae.AAC.4
MVIVNAIAACLAIVGGVTAESTDTPPTAPLTATDRDGDSAVAHDTPRPTDDTLTPPADEPTERVGTGSSDLERHFRRGLGAYPLRSRAPTALLTVREVASNPDVHARNTGCAFVANTSNADPKTRKQALRDDRAGWTAAERVEIANHTENGSWELVDRTSVPAG